MYPYRTAKRLIALFAFAALPASVAAVDGVIEINQAAAEAGGITPDDTAGFPVILSESGSYVLTSNLDVPAGTGGIEVRADGVTIDLNGFQVVGNGGEGGNGIGVVNTDAGVLPVDVSVRNGTVRDMGGNGIRLGDNSLVRDVVSRDNRYYGVIVGNDSIVRSSRLVSNVLAGIFSDTRRVVVVDSVISGNTYYGVEVDNAVIRDNVISNNALHGVYCDVNCVIRGNTITGNGDAGIRAWESGYGANVIRDNNGGNSNPQVDSDPTLIELSPNLCGTDNTCP